MLANAVDYSDEILHKERINDISVLLESNQLKILSLRNCTISDQSFKKLIKSCGLCQSLLHLSLSVDVVTNQYRLELLAQCLRKNKLLKSLHIHGNPIGDDGMKVIAEALSYNSRVSSLDVGDCNLGDSSIQHLRLLLTPTSVQEGLSELSLSANTAITASGWSSLAMTVAHSPNLRCLYLDYNALGDSAVCSILVGVAANQQMEVLDLEGTGITEKSTQLLLDMLQNYPGNLRKITLSENTVKKSTVAAIKEILRTNVPEDASFDASEDDFLSTTIGTESVASETLTSSCRSSNSELDTSAENQSDVSECGTVIVRSDSEESAEVSVIKPVKSSSVEGKKKAKRETEEESDLGEELKEVPVFW